MNRKRVLAVSAVLIVLLAGCATAEAYAPASPRAVESAAAPSETPTVTASASATASAIASPTATPTTTLTRLDLPVVLLDPTRTPTVTPTATATPLRFAVIGDYGLAGQAEADVADLVHSWQPAFIITTGDNNYPLGEAATIDENIGQYYHDYIFPYSGGYGPGAEINRFFPSLGNHDYYSANGNQPYLDYFTLPGNERYYDFIWGPLHFFVINSDYHEPDGVGASSLQADWLEAELTSSSAPWQLVYFHNPPFTSGTYHGGTDWMDWPFALWGTDVVLSGHEHIYERLHIDGIPYLIDGLGGGARYWCGEPVTGSQVCYADDWGALKVDATAEQLIFEFVTRSGAVIDHFELVK